MTGYYDDIFDPRSNARSVGWRDAWGQAARFVAAYEFMAPNHSVIDLGCGRGDFLRYLRHVNHRGEYLGVDCYAGHAAYVPEGEFLWDDFRDCDQTADVAVALGTLVGNHVHDSISGIELLRTAWNLSTHTVVICALDPDWIGAHIVPDPALRGVSIIDVEAFALEVGAFLHLEQGHGPPDNMFVLSRAPIASGDTTAARYLSVASFAKPNPLAAVRLALELELDHEADAVLAENPDDAELVNFYEILKEKRGTHNGTAS